jgi:hypothetical protein
LGEQLPGDRGGRDVTESAALDPDDDHDRFAGGRGGNVSGVPGIVALDAVVDVLSSSGLPVDRTRKAPKHVV